MSLRTDTHALDSIELLTNAGIDFEKNVNFGIDPFDFGAAIMMSGVVLSNAVTWISFHSGYDFAYLLKILTVCILLLVFHTFFAY